MLKLLSLIVSFSLLCACASEKYFNEHLQSYVGKPSTTVLTSVGPPQQTMKMSDARTLWIYEYSHQSYLAESIDPNSSFLLPIAHSCRYWFDLNDKEIVTAVGHKGNHCRTSKSGQRGILLPLASPD